MKNLTHKNDFIKDLTLFWFTQLVSQTALAICYIYVLYSTYIDDLGLESAINHPQV